MGAPSPVFNPSGAGDDYGSPVSSPIAAPPPTYSSSPSNDDYGSPLSSSSSISSNDFAAPSPVFSPATSNDDYGSPVSSPISSPAFSSSSSNADYVSPVSSPASSSYSVDSPAVSLSSYESASDPVPAPASSDDFNSFSFGSGQSLEPSSYAAVTDLVSEGEGSIIPSSDFSSAVSSPSSSLSDYAESPAPPQGDQTSDLYGAPVSDIFTGTQADSLDSQLDNFDVAPVYNTIDTNSLESGLAPDVFTPSVLEETEVQDSYGSPVEDAAVPAPESYLPSSEYNDYDEAPSYDIYSNQDYLEDLPSYVIPSGDSYQAAPSISIEYASPRDELRRNDVESQQAGLVIDLTAQTEPGEVPQFGQRLGSQSESSELLAKSHRHRRRWTR